MEIRDNQTQRTGSSFPLNEYSEAILYGAGNVADDIHNGIEEFSEQVSGTIFGAATTLSDFDQTRWDMTVTNSSKDIGLPTEYLKKYMPSSLRPGTLSGIFSAAGSAIDTLSGVVSVLRQPRIDAMNNDRLNIGTMREISKAVGKTTLTAATAQIAGGVAATALAGVAAPTAVAAALPAVVAVGGALAAGYAFDLAVDRIAQTDFPGTMRSMYNAVKFW